MISEARFYVPRFMNSSRSNLNDGRHPLNRNNILSGYKRRTTYVYPQTHYENGFARAAFCSCKQELQGDEWKSTPYVSHECFYELSGLLVVTVPYVP